LGNHSNQYTSTQIDSLFKLSTRILLSL